MYPVMGRLLLDLLLYVLGATIMMAAGLGILALLRVRIDRATAALLAPTVTQTVWATALGFGVAGRVPVRTLAIPIWIAMLAFALYGCRVWATRELMVDQQRSLGERLGFSITLVSCFLLPIAVLLPYVVYGFSEYLGSRLPDGWFYIAHGQYLWSMPRGSEGGLPVLYQYASHSADARPVASAQVGLLSVVTAPGDTQSATGLFLMLGLFGYASACGAFARSRMLSPKATYLFLALSVCSGWTLNVILANNYDNLIALTFFVGFATVASALRPDQLGWWLLAGMLAAGAIYTYPEVSPLLGGIVLTMILQRLWQSSERAPFAYVVCGIGFGLFLLSPYLTTIVQFLGNESSLVFAVGARPGEGQFAGLLDASDFTTAFWALGGEHQFPGLWALRTLAGASLFVVLVVGGLRLVRSRDMGILAALVLPLVAAPILILLQAYSYGAYKMIILGWWAIAFALVSGATAAGVGSRWRATITAAAVLACLAIPAFAAARVARDVIRPYPVRMANFRAVSQVSERIAHAPIGFFVEDWEASQWAVYFLRDHPLKVGDVGGYLNTPQARPLLDRATALTWDQLRYVITDAVDPGPVIENQNWTLMWQNGDYRLWDTNGDGWAIVTEVSTPNGFERVDGEPFFWMGGGPTRLQLVTNDVGCLHVQADIVAGVKTPASEVTSVKLETSSGMIGTLQLVQGLNTFQILVGSGSNEILLTPVALTDFSHAAPDRRQFIAGIRHLTTSFEAAEPLSATDATIVEPISGNDRPLASGVSSAGVESVVSQSCR